MGIPFIKMHGLGNDFVILDARRGAALPAPAQCRRIADRRTGVGCDQIVILTAPKNSGADVSMDIRNADGSDGGACGNAARCVARLVLDDAPAGKNSCVIEVARGLLRAHRHGTEYTVDMGPARLGWQDIPLAHEADTLQVDVGLGLPRAVCVSMGNPHAVFLVPDAETADVAGLGPQVEHHPLFPARTNVEFASLCADGRLRLRVWERGTGQTLACGTGACATLVAAVRRGLCGREARVQLDGGMLAILWREDGHVEMTGPATFSFSGNMDETLWGAP